MPAPRFGLSFAIRFDEPAIGVQALSLTLTGARFEADLADCRTFCRRSEVEGLQARGLARGGSLENAIVVEGDRVLNPQGLRRPDEFVRHKMLDAVGDLALAGAPIIGHFEGVRAGHEMTSLLLHALFDTPDAWEFAWAQPGLVPQADVVRTAPARAAGRRAARSAAQTRLAV